MTNRGDQSLYDTYIVLFSEPVTGLTYHSTVTFNGVTVGFVNNIVINPQDPQQVKTYLSILRNTPLNTSASARLRSQGITGVSFIDLNIEDIHAPAFAPQSGKNYPVITASPSLFTTFESVVEKLGASVDQVSKQLDMLFNDETMKTINATINNIEQSSDLLAHQLLPNINQVTSRIDQMTINLEKLSDELRQNPATILHGKPIILGPGE